MHAISCYYWSLDLEPIRSRESSHLTVLKCLIAHQSMLLHIFDCIQPVMWTVIKHWILYHSWLIVTITCRNICCIHAGNQRPTWDELISVQRKNSQQDLRIKSTISSYGYVPCCDFGILLLHDSTFVMRLRHDYRDSDARFVLEVLGKWLEQDDDSTVIRTPCTWKGLCDCISRTPGLPGSLAKHIRDEFVNKYVTVQLSGSVRLCRGTRGHTCSNNYYSWYLISHVRV